MRPGAPPRGAAADRGPPARAAPRVAACAGSSLLAVLVCARAGGCAWYLLSHDAGGGEPSSSSRATSMSARSTSHSRSTGESKPWPSTRATRPRPVRSSPRSTSATSRTSCGSRGPAATTPPPTSPACCTARARRRSPRHGQSSGSGRRRSTSRKANLKRGEQLAPGGAISKEEVDQRRQAVQVGEANVNYAKAALRLAEIGPRQEDIDAARAMLGQQEAMLIQSERRLADADLIAPADGIILTRAASAAPSCSPARPSSP